MIRKQLKTQHPSNLLFFDTETKPCDTKSKKGDEYHYLWFGMIQAFRLEGTKRTRELRGRFETVEEFWNIVEKRLDDKRPLYCFAHNVCFDLTIVDFWRELKRREWEVEFFVLDDPPTMFGIRSPHGRMYFVDTLNYWRTSLAKLGESLIFPKLQMPGKDGTKEDWDKYCFRDVEVLSESVCNLINFLVENDLGKFQMTAASLAMSAYKHRFIEKHKIYIHDRLNVCKLERSAYYGGLVECFHVNPINHKVYNVDVNSLYPTMMLQPVPTRLIGEAKLKHVGFLKPLLPYFATVAMVKINSQQETFPVKVDGKLCMAKGEFVTSLCGPELKRAYETRSIESVLHLAWYEQQPVLAEYVQFFWDKRKQFKAEDNQVFQTFCKLLMNSLYGKFGQRGHQWIDFDMKVLRGLYQFYGLDLPQCYRNRDIAPHFEWGTESHKLVGLRQGVGFRKIRGKLQIKFPIVEHHESFPLISAYITSYGREYLGNLIRIAGRETVYYCDTDSLYCSNIGYNRLLKAGWIDDKELGKLKLEGIADSAQFFCPKDYIFGAKEKHKGIKEKAELLPNGKYKQPQFEGIKSVLNREPLPYIRIKDVEKKPARTYDKGMIGPDGWVEPFTLLDNQVLELF